ncbi:amino acid ABC transporter permease [Anaerosporobacter sp.]
MIKAKKTFKTIVNIKEWEKNTKQFFGTIFIAFLIMTVFACLKPSKSELMNSATEVVEKAMKDDEGKTRKELTVTYNNLYFINYCSFETAGANAISEKYLGFAGQIYNADEGAANVAGRLVNYTYRMLGCGQGVLYGAKLTIFLTTASVLCGFILSIFLALGKISKSKLLSKLCGGYIFFFRGTPLMIQIFVIYLAIPGMIPGFNWRGLFSDGDPDAVFKGAFVAAFIAFTLNTAAYCAEIVRAAIQSIDKGQFEAAKALGMSYGQTMKLIVIPQSIRRLIPPVCNEFIMVLKDVSLVFVIGLMDITTISKTIASSGSYLVFIPALVIYLLITAFFTFIFNKVEKKFSVYE